MGSIHYLAQPNPTEPPVARESIGIAELDSRLQEQIAEHDSIKVFHITLWRHDPDATGCNWNARVERVKGNWINDFAWWGVVPQLRERFNLA